MDEILISIANKITDTSNKRKALSKALSNSGLKHPIEDINLGNLKICGVDGGFLKKDYHGARIILRRAVAVCFNFKDGILESCDYLPNTRPFPEPIIVDPEISDQEFNIFSNLKREELELEIALKAVEKFKPDILIRDGSIILHPSSIPLESSEVYKDYLKVTGLFKQLYSECEKNDVLLAGAIEDSKGKRYCGYLLKYIITDLLNSSDEETKKLVAQNHKILENTNDTLFLYYFLKTGERVEPMTYNFKEEKIYSIYIKSVEYDRPLRIDFFSAKEKLNQNTKNITEIIHKISKHNRNYSYPSVLIEADARAKLTEVEIEHFKSALAEKLGNNPTLLELRREGRQL
ncbi:MAG: DNA double-strand break repair nuclease NurA [Nanoarchaeota archaeon]